MTNITGVRTTNNILQNRRVVDMAKQIALLDPNEGPLLSFLKLAKNNSRCVYNPKFEWLEDDLMETWSSVSEEHTAATTTIKTADGTIFRVGDIVKVPSTGECMLVSAISTNDLTVTRAYGSTTAAVIADDAELLIIGSAMPENSNGREVKSTVESNGYNYTQIFRTPIALSGTEAASKLHGGRDRAYQRRKASLEHKRDIARALYFGERKEDVSGSAPRRTMGGLLEFLNNSETTVTFNNSTKPLTYRNFDSEVAAAAFRYGSKEKLLIAGPYLASAINSWSENRLVSDIAEDATYGIRVKNLITTYGDLKVIYDPLLEGSYNGYGFVLDPENIRYAYLDGRDTKLYTDIQDNDIDGVIDEYLTECSLELRLPKTHMMITGCYIPTA